MLEDSPSKKRRERQKSHVVAGAADEVHEGNMTSVAKEEKLTAPVVLAVIGGGLMVIGGIVSLAMTSYHAMYGHTMFGTMMYNGLQSVMVLATPWIIWTSIGAIICGGLILYGSYLLHINPQTAKTSGLVILIISGIALFLGHGFWVGPILGMIGGLWAMSRKW